MKLNNPYDNEDSMYSGQLLLSYPSIESYIISNFEKDIYNIHMGLGRDIKSFIYYKRYMQINKIDKSTLLNATNEFINYLKSEDIDWNMDEFKDASINIFEKQESYYLKDRKYKLFSMLTLAFIQLGIIEIR